MTLIQLEYIVAVDEHRHFASAAKACFVTQPTLSMQIQKLEDQLGVMIFDRSKQPVVPTIIGVEIISQARVVLREAGKIKERIDEEKGVINGELKIGVLPTLSPYLIPLFVKSFTDKYPEVQLQVEELVTEVIIDRLHKSTLDLGILATPTGVGSLSEKVIFNEEFVGYVSNEHPLASVTAIDPFLLEADDIWLLNEGHCFRNQVLNICQSPSINQQLSFKSGSLEALKKLVDKQGGMTLIPELATLDLSENELKHLRWFKEPRPVREISIVTHRSFMKTRLTEALYNVILAAIPDDLKSKKNTARIRWN